MTPRSRNCRPRAVTLLEVVLAMGILVLVSSMTYWFYSSVLETRRSATEAARKLQLARVVVERMATEIRQASLVAGQGRVGLRGAPEQLWIYTHRLPGRKVAEQYLRQDDTPPGEFDLVSIEYKIARHPEIQHDEGWDMPLGLARIEHRVPQARGQPDEDVLDILPTDEEAEPTVVIDESADLMTIEDIDWEELYAPQILHLRFCYFDGYRWWDEWDIESENPLPQIVQVTIGFEPRAPFGEELGYGEEEEFCLCLNEDSTEECEPLAEDLYQRLVRVPQADTFFRSRIARETQALLEEVGETSSAEAGG